MYFRDDGEFYAELDEKLTEARKKEIRFVTGTNGAQTRRGALHPGASELKRAWDWFRENTRPARVFLKSKLGVDLTDAV